ncbi:MAG: toxin-antitoxin system HicB family antitoxin [Deltaproteobacteria bacterium]|nr:toxin-antitoxin system HicB family antitoxin [Deltaproteobacteria bacterium]MBN2670666.1 toxin-antitoxin system HicB family antitoxin [Deltaproteobacteria bacterium]
MARVTLRVPDSLHAALANRAKEEGVSMNQFLVFALSRIAASDDIALQKTRYDQLLGRHSQAEADASLQDMLASRE